MQEGGAENLSNSNWSALVNEKEQQGGVVVMPMVKLHYSVEGDTTVLTSFSANISKLDFIFRGFPGQPEGFKATKLENTDGTEITDYSSKPPQTVYVIGVLEK